MRRKRFVLAAACTGVAAIAAFGIASGAPSVHAVATPRPSPTTFYVTERWHHAIAKVTIDASGTSHLDESWLTTLPNNGPDSVIFEPSGKMLISNSDAGYVEEFDPTAKTVVRAQVNSSALSDVADLAINPMDDKYVWAIAWNSTIYKINLTTGETTLLAPNPTQVGGIAFSNKGRLFATTHDGYVYELSPADGAVLSRVQVNGFPDGITFDPLTGNLFVAGCHLADRSGPNSICELAVTAGLTAMREYPGTTADGLSAGGDGYVYFADPEQDTLSRLDITTGDVALIAQAAGDFDDPAPVAGAGAPPTPTPTPTPTPSPSPSASATPAASPSPSPTGSVEATVGLPSTGGPAAGTPTGAAFAMFVGLAILLVVGASVVQVRRGRSG